MERCPNCSARSSGAPICRRCGMELGGLLEIEQAAERLLERAMDALMAGDYASAQLHLRRARALRDTPLNRQLLGFVSSRLAETLDRGPAPTPPVAAASDSDLDREHPLLRRLKNALSSLSRAIRSAQRTLLRHLGDFRNRFYP